MGPAAGLDLARKILKQTLARHDQDHLGVVLLSLPESIPDRTAFLMGEASYNPAVPIGRILECLEHLGARVVGMPCNTAHVARIYDAVQAHLASRRSQLRLLHMPLETVRFVRENYPICKTVGVLATSGSLHHELYKEQLKQVGFQVVTLDENRHKAWVQGAIYDPGYGIKACAHPVSARAKADLSKAVAALRNGGAEVIILGCTELPLALPESALGGIPLVDPTFVLARALIYAVAPEKLKHLSQSVVSTRRT